MRVTRVTDAGQIVREIVDSSTGVDKVLKSEVIGHMNDPKPPSKSLFSQLISIIRKGK